MTLGLSLVLSSAALIGAGTGLTLWQARRREARAHANHPPLGQFLDVDGHRIHALQMGQGPDVTLIHGASGNLRDFTYGLAPMLAQNYRVTLFDRPGLGYSDPLHPRGATIHEQAQILNRALDQMGVDQTILLGHSYGGSVALTWAVQHPDRLSGLVLVAPAAMPWDTPLDRFYQITSHPVLGRIANPLIAGFAPKTKVDEGLQSVFDPDPVPGDYADHFGIGLTLRRSSLHNNARQRANLLDEIMALHEHYPGITAPTEILHGTADDTVGMHIHSEPLADLIPDAALTRMEGIGHMPHHVAPDSIVAAIRRVGRRAGLNLAN